MLSLAVLLVGTVFWLFGGPNLGWTKTSVLVTTRDPVTDLEQPEWQRNFIPGVDFLGATVVLAGVLWGASFLARRSTTSAGG